MSALVHLTIDGCPIEIEAGATLLDAARAAGIYIPVLCSDDDLHPYGACRLCLVEVEGQRRAMLPSCTTPVTEGMVIRTTSATLEQVRRSIVELLLSDHPTDCLSCPRNNRCDLQRVAAYMGLREQRFHGEKHPAVLDNSNPFYIRDLERCILCGKCVRTCDEIQNRRAIHYAYRGLKTKIAAELDRDVRDSLCEFCGQCVTKCPVGALYTRSEFEHGSPTGVTKTICPYCGVGCGLILETRGSLIIGAVGDRDNPVNQGRTCVKGRFGYDFVNHPDRLTTPLIKRGGQFVPGTWDEAMDLVADKLVGIKKQCGGDSIAVLSSAKCTNEENYLLQKFTRAVLETNNIDHCARL